MFCLRSSNPSSSVTTVVGEEAKETVGVDGGQFAGAAVSTILIGSSVAITSCIDDEKVVKTDVHIS